MRVKPSLCPAQNYYSSVTVTYIARDLYSPRFWAQARVRYRMSPLSVGKPKGIQPTCPQFYASPTRGTRMTSPSDTCLLQEMEESRYGTGGQLTPRASPYNHQKLSFGLILAESALLFQGGRKIKKKTFSKKIFSSDRETSTTFI